MRLFEFRDPTPIEAFALAPSYDRARKMFRRHLQANGGDADTLLWRERSLDDLDQVEQSAIKGAMSIGRPGLVSRVSVGRWVFIIPLLEQLDSKTTNGD